MTIGIYKITCKETGRCYIGQSKHIEKRWGAHNKRFPPQFFDYEVLVTCPIVDLDELEKLMIETFDSHYNGFNKTIGGAGIKSKFVSEITRYKLSIATKGKKVPSRANGNKGKTVPEISERLKGNTFGSAKKGMKHEKKPCQHCGKIVGPQRFHKQAKCKMKL